jgi:hypothetical protein
MAHADVMKRRELELSFGWPVVRAPTGGRCLHPVVTVEPLDQDRQHLLDSIAKLDEYESSSAEVSSRDCATRA